MGLPVLNFKFLPDRCHWERNSSCLPWQEGGGRGGLWRPLTLRSCNLLILSLQWCGGPALYSLQSSFQTLAQPHSPQQPEGEAGMHAPK